MGIFCSTSRDALYAQLVSMQVQCERPVGLMFKFAYGGPCNHNAVVRLGYLSSFQFVLCFSVEGTYPAAGDCVTCVTDRPLG